LIGLRAIRPVIVIFVRAERRACKKRPHGATARKREKQQGGKRSMPPMCVGGRRAAGGKIPGSSFLESKGGKQMLAKRLFIMAVVLGLAGSALGVALPVEGLKIDVQASSGNPTLTGWTKWNTGLPTGGGGSAANLTVSGITFAMSGNNLSCRTTAGGDNVTQEAAFTDHNVSGDKIRVTISGLDNGTYEVTTIHRWFWPYTEYIDIYSGTTLEYDDVGFTNTGTAEPLTAVNRTFDIVIDGSNDYFELVTNKAGSNGEYKAALNGFILTPEPATVALLGLGSLILFRRRR
jgi:hypothetical protein